MAPKDKNDDLGQAEVQDVRDKAREQGFEGTSPSTIPNSEFSLETGPDSPSAAEQAAATAEARAQAARDTVKKDGSRS